MISTGCLICCVEASSKKRKKFHGASCKKARDIIDDVLNEEFRLTIWSFVETSMSTAYLCFQCEKKILSICTMKERLLSIKSELLQRLSNFHQKATTGIGQKRSISAAVNVSNNSSDSHNSNHTATSTIPSSSVAATNAQAASHLIQLNSPSSTPTQPQATTCSAPNPLVRRTISTPSPDITIGC